MTKFVVYSDSYECSITPATGATAEQIWAAYQAEASTDPRTIGCFATLDEAKAELEKFSPSTRSGKTNTGWIAWGTLAWIEEEEHDEDDDFVNTNCIWSYSVEALPPEEDEEDEEDEDDRATDSPIIRSYSSNVTIQWCGDSLTIGHSGDDLAAYTEFDLYENEDEAHAEWDADVLINIRDKFPRLGEYHNLDEIVHRVAMAGHLLISDIWASMNDN